MGEIHPQVKAAREKSLASDHLGALEILERALSSEPGCPELLAERGLLLTLLQREDEALECLLAAPTAPEASRLAQVLRNYFFCRASMATKLGFDDALGRELQGRLDAEFPGAPTPQTGIRLSACLIVKNESKHLPRCLESISGKVDEIVVVDTGSTDDTVEIAREFGAVVGFFEWCDDFAAARNESLRLATGDWALWIDADETVDPASWNAIQEGLMRPQFGGYYLDIVNYMDESGENACYIHAPVRLFRLLPETTFEGRIHEQIIPSLDRMGLPCASLKGAKIHHFGYRPSDMAEKRKAERAIRMLEREVRESPGDAFQWFNLANAYSVVQRHEDAIQAARKCIALLDPRNAYASLAYQILSCALTLSGRPAEALSVCEEARERGHFTVLNSFELTHALFRLRRFEEALEASDECMGMTWPEGLTGDFSILTYKRHTLRGQILCELGRLNEALSLLDHSLSLDPEFAIARFSKGIVLEKMGRTESALDLYESCFESPGIAQPALKAAARVCRSLGREADARSLSERAWYTDPDDLDSWSEWVSSLERDRNIDGLLRAYEAYAKLREPNTAILINWGRALQEAGEFEAALRCFVQAIQQSPGDPNAHFNAGDALYRMDSFSQATQFYESGLRLDPTNPEGWFMLGNAMGQIGVWQGAKLAYEQALRFDPNHEKALANLSVAVEELAVA